MLSNLEWLPLLQHSLLPTTSGIYLLKGPTGKLYAGKSVNIRQRVADHRYKVLIAGPKATYLSRSVAKYGPESFQVAVYALAQVSELDALEVSVIRDMQLQAKGYNRTSGGEGTPGRVVSDAQRKAMSDRFKGTKLSAETKAKIKSSSLVSASSKRGVPRSLEARLRMREGCIGRVMPARGPMPIGQKLRIGEGNKGKLSSGSNPKAKPVALWLVDSFLPMEFACGRDAARFLGLPYRKVANWCSGKYPPSLNIAITYM